MNGLPEHRTHAPTACDSSRAPSHSVQVDPTSEGFRDATHVALDPSCSGSGIVQRGAAHAAADGGLAESFDREGVGGGQDARLHHLAAMQEEDHCATSSHIRVHACASQLNSLRLDVRPL